MAKRRQLILLLGDQLDRQSPVLAGPINQNDLVLMIEARGESRRVPSHKARTVLFLSAMRHHAAWLREQGYNVVYVDINDRDASDFETAIANAIQRYQPSLVRMVEAGEFGVQQRIQEACETSGIELQVLTDSHFLCSREDFARWRGHRKSLVMETFYRHMRKRLGILMDGDAPSGGKWNFDAKNRTSFGRQGPGLVPPPPAFTPDAITRQAISDVEHHFPDNPGELANFAWPTSREQALVMLEDFISHRLPAFGPFQDAMWTEQVLLYHSGLSAALNLKLLHPMEVIEKAEAAYRAGDAPLASVEGFIRQVLGWREFVRGIYWSEMPAYLQNNALNADQPLPAFYWTGDTDMHCLRSVIKQTLQTGYAHHIQRLMVTGLFALLLGVRPEEIHAWYLGIYIDAVEWVEAPNTLGMSQYADGGLLASKPYAASGRYIQRMSNYCKDCRFKPDRRVGEQACPFTLLYWDFLIRHETRFARHPRAAMQWRMLHKLEQTERMDITFQAKALRETWR